jgi:hypothetical protein
MVLVFYFVFKNVPRGTFLKRVLQIIIATSIIQSIVGIIQFFIQHSMGLLWLKESIISPNIPGVAKLIFNGHTYIRSYGLFPHSNILGGFLVLSIISSLLYFKMFYTYQGIAKCSTWNIFKEKVVINVPRGTLVLFTIISIQGLALLLTFSKSAIIGLFMGLLYLYITKCSTWNIFSIFNLKKHFYKKMFLFVSIIILTSFILKPDMYSLFLKSLQERIFYLNVSRGTFLSHPLIGIGSGQFVVNMQVVANIQSWQYQPVHNVFLLILNEFGIVIFFMFLYFIYKMFHLGTNVPRGTFYGANVKHYTRVVNVYFKAALVSFVFIMLFDHYFWDIQQGQILLWIVFGAIIGEYYSQPL